MSIIIPYSVEEVVTGLSLLLNVNLEGISEIQKVLLTIIANGYFFLTWWFIIWCILKGLNWVYERLC